MNIITTFLFVTVFALPVISSLKWPESAYAEKKSNPPCRKNNPDYTFPQRGWEVATSYKGEYPFLVSVSLRRPEDNVHCHWCPGVIVGKRTVLVVNCGAWSKTKVQMRPEVPKIFSLYPEHFLVYDELDISRNKSLWNVLQDEDEEEAKHFVPVIYIYPFYPRPKASHILRGYAHLLTLAQPFNFDKNIQCLPVSKLNFNPPPVSKVEFLQWCHHNEGNDIPHNWKTYTLHKVSAERDCEKWGIEDKLFGEGLVHFSR